MTRILLVDHEDSFVYNLYQGLLKTGVEVRCIRYTVPESAACAFDPDGIVLSPGPGHPSDRTVTGLSRRLLREFGVERPTLGVCLGHQLIGEFYGGRVVRSGDPVHGETERVAHGESALYRGIPSPFRAARYHSLVLERRSVPSTLDVTAHTPSGLIMGVRHRSYPVEGIQFHPESYLTQGGDRMLRNFVEEVRR